MELDYKMNISVITKGNDEKTEIKKDIKIAGVVILYNPEDDVYDNIMTYASSLDTLYILDNSDCPNTDVIKQIKTIPCVRYIKHGCNM